MRLLVTGGAGFIGSNFIERTLNLFPDYGITVLDSLTYAGRLENLTNYLDKINFVQGNILDSGLVNELMAQSDAAVHFAAESHNDNSLKDPERFFETNLMGTLELVRSAVKHDVRMHHVSTDEVFGDLPLDSSEKFHLDSPYRPSSPYSASKAASDHLVRAWVRSFGLKATISNCSNNYGPNQHEEKLIPRTIKLALGGNRPELYGSGLNSRDWIHVDDHSDAILAILDRGKVGKTYLLATSNERSNLTVVRTILGILGKPKDWISFIEDRPGHDLRYALDAGNSYAELAWHPCQGDFEVRLTSVVEHFVKKFSMH
jgi:dTDP-glucose 4,6-dehydratase